MRRSIIIGIWMIISVCLIGCAGLRENWFPKQKTPQELKEEELGEVSFVQFTKTYPSNDKREITIMTGRPPEKYIELGMLSVRFKDSVENLTQLLKMKATAVGADAIINYETIELPVSTKTKSSISLSTNGSNPPSNYDFVYENKVSGIAIKYETGN
jgi:hypothetical protein